MTLRGRTPWLALVLAAVAFAPSAARTDKAPVGTFLKTEWAAEHSDITPDPAVHFGRLPNGMAYVIYKNATPQGTAAIHLRIGAGALMEDDNQRGLAHFLEHMAFNGSKNIPMDELIPLMQRHGLKLGPDAGAFTAYNKTEYTFALPKTDDETVDTALMIFREIAGNLLLAPEAVERERAVVLGEERLRDSPMLHTTRNLFAAEFPDQRLGTHYLAIGLPEVIKSAPPQRLADFYHAFYRPELATLVVVGDIDPVALEAKIKARFSDWKASAPAKPIDFGSRKPSGLEATTYSEKTLPDQISLSWIKPYDGGPETHASDTRDMLDDIIVGAFNQRLNRLAQQPDSNFIGAGLRRQKFYRSADTISLGVTPKPGKDKEAYAQVLLALKRLTEYGLSADEVEIALTNQSARYQNAVKSERTRNNDGIMRELITCLDENEVITSPAQNQAFFEAIKPQLTVEALNARLKVLITGDGPKLFHQGEDVASLDQNGLKSGLTEAMSQAVTPYVSAAKKPWPYTDFGPAKAPVSQVENKPFGFTQYVYANGLKLNVKQTNFKDDQILVQVRFGGGLESLPANTEAPVSLATIFAMSGGVLNGGLGQLTIDELRKSLAGKTVNISYNLGDQAAHLSAAVTKADFALEMQYLMAFTTDAAWRPDFYARIKASLPTVYASMSSSPMASAAPKVLALTHEQDKRFVFPTLDEANAVPFEAIRNLVADSLKNAPIEITLVGDIDDKSALAAVNATFAVLPKLPKSPRIAKGADVVRFPAAAKTVTFTHKGRADQSLSLFVWPVPDYLSDTPTSNGLLLLREILNKRMFDQIREKLGQAYDPGASLSQSMAFKGFGVFQAHASVPAGQDGAFEAALGAIIADLQTNPVSADELDRARKPVLEHFDNSQKDNNHWVYIVAHGMDEPARLAAEQNFKAGIAAVTPNDIQALAKRYLVNSRVVHVEVEPEAKPN
ncbi:MAG: insulinase family protein [Rhizomicrobium sp.]|nr:insulinase family protein [Rhizomicrobium sp.]